MTGIVIIDFADKEKEEKFNINYLALAGRCEVHITINKDKKTSNFLEYNQEKEHYLIDKISLCENLINDQETYWKKEYELLSMLKDGKRNFLSYVDEVEIIDFTEDIAEYIRKNNELHNKKIKILKEYALDEKSILKLKKISKNIKNIYFSFDTIPEYISIKTAEKYLTLKNKIIEQTNRHEYSQLEKIMYIYDKVKEYECPDVFQQIIQDAGFKTRKFILSHADKGLYKKHIRSLIHINDDKYKVNGAFFFDPKLELSESDKTKSNINNYKFFAKNLEMMEYYDLYKKYIDITEFPALSEMKTENIHNKYLSSVHAFLRMPNEIGVTINNLFSLFDEKGLKIPLNNSSNITEENNYIATQTKYYYTKIEGKKRTLKNKISKYIDMFYNTIDSKTLMHVLSYVRDTELKENKKRYKYDYETLIKASINSDWGINRNTKISKHGKREMEILFDWFDDNESKIEELPVDNIYPLLEDEKYMCIEKEEGKEEKEISKEPEVNEIIVDTAEVEIDNYELPILENEESKGEFEGGIDLIFDEELIFDENIDIDDSKEDINIYIKNCLNAILSDNDDEDNRDDEIDKK